MEQRMIARVVIQMLGAPKKHIEDTLKMYVDKIEEEHKDIKILKRYQSKAKLGKDKLFNVFAELELEVRGAEQLVWFCFDYMPASVEILEPETFTYESHEFTNFLNDLQAKLHKTDMAIKGLSAENQVLKKNAMTLVRNIILVQLSSGPSDLKTLSKRAGVPEDHMLAFLKELIQEGKVRKEGDQYV